MTRLIRIVPIVLLAALLSPACGLNSIMMSGPTKTTKPKTETGTQAPPIEIPIAPIAILKVEVVGPSVAFVKVGEREWPTRPDLTIIEEFPAGTVANITVRADGFLSREMKNVSLSAGVGVLRFELQRVPAPPVPNLVIKGRQFYDGDTGLLYVPRWVSGLTLLARTAEQQEAFLAWATKTGFNGVRVFAGALTWAGQTPESARAALTPLLDRAARHGLVIEVTALTDTGIGYDAKQHLAGIVERIAGRRGVVLELANEIGHGTQSADITPERMRAWGVELVRPRGILWAVGATLESDEPINGVYAGHGGDYSTAHLDRGRPTWNQVRRVREIYAIAEVHGAPAVNNEPIGCAEPGTAGQRWNDPAMFFALGALDRAFAVGGVHHSQAGLLTDLPGTVQQACADGYVAAHRAIEAVLPGAVGHYKNVGHDGSPLVGATFVEGGSADGVVRAYSFVSGDRGVLVLVGARGDTGLRWGSGWRQVRVVDSRTAHDGRAVIVLEIRR